MSTTSSVKSNSPIDSPILYSQWWLARRSRRLAEELVISHVGGGWMRVPCSVELSIPSLNSETAAYLQQSSIYDWAQSKRSERGRWDVSGVDHSFVVSS